MKNDYQKVPILHIYPQRHHHDEAIIIGNRKGIERLKDTLEKALENGAGDFVVATSDIESYQLYCFVNEEGLDSDFWQSLNLPYVDFVDDGIIRLEGEDLLDYKIKNSDDLKKAWSVIEQDREQSKIILRKIMEGVEKRK